MPRRGLIPRDGWKIVRVSSEAAGNGKLAKHVIDGEPRTHWHTRFGDETAKHPHELLIDMGAVHEVRGFVYLARQDQGWNGALAKCEFFVGDSAQDLGKRGEPAARATFGKDKSPQRVTCATVKGRYVLLRVLSEVNGGPWASVAEFAVVGK